MKTWGNTNAFIAFVLLLLCQNCFAATGELIDHLYADAALNFTSCALQAKTASATAQLHGDKNAATDKAYKSFNSCRENELNRAATAIEPLKRELEAKPKATEALKEFYTYWRSSLQNINGTTNDNSVTSEFRRKLEKVRTEAEW